MKYAPTTPFISKEARGIIVLSSANFAADEKLQVGDANLPLLTDFESGELTFLAPVPCRLFGDTEKLGNFIGVVKRILLSSHACILLPEESTVKFKSDTAGH